MEQYIQIGAIKKSHGIKGELKCFVEDVYEDDLLAARVVFVTVRGVQTPFFVEGFRGGNELIIKLEEVDTREAALALAGKPLYLRRQDLREVAEDEGGELADHPFAFLQGFVIHTEPEGELGAIESILELPQHYLAVIRYRGQERYIPLNEDFILSVDERARTVLMELPAGLLDL